MAKRICISIAVSQPEKLESLPGAITASNDVLDWARAAGFDTALSISDTGGDRVTVARLNAALMPILSDAADTIDHLVIHFAGHGIAADAEDQFLLLSDWLTKPDEAIRLSRFVRLLQFYQPNRVSLFIDACRSRPTRDADDLNGSGILDRPDEEPVEFLEDRFRAVVNATESYMVKDLTGGQPRCLFTTVLLKALCGIYPEAIDVRGARKFVTSGQIQKAIKKHLPEEAALYRLEQTPSLKPGFVAPDDVYTQIPISYTPPDLPVPVFASPAKGATAMRLEAECETRDQTERLTARLRARYRAEELPSHFETGSGLAINGAAVRGIPVSGRFAQVEADRKTAGGSWWRLAFADPGSWPASNLAVELADGPWVCAVALPRMILAITVDARARVGPTIPELAPPTGAVSMIYRPAAGWVPDDDRIRAVAAAEEIVAKLGAGALSADDAMTVAAQIRHMKHVDPMLGVIAAYLYDAAGDRDSIRRIAWFYAQRHEPIPYDVALLADLKCVRTSGKYEVVVPAVTARAPRTAEEERHPDYFRATEEIRDATVAGGFPWLRQGWSLLDAVDFPVLPALIELAGSLLPMPFTTLKPEAGRAFADLIRRGVL